MDPTVGTFAGSIVELTDLLTEADLLTEDILIPTEDIPPASDNILVRFTVGITRPAQTNTASAPEISAVVDAFGGAELNCSESRRGAVPAPPVSAHDVAGGCCAAGFQSDLCPLWVRSGGDDRGDAAADVCFAPERWGNRPASLWIAEELGCRASG